MNPTERDLEVLHDLVGACGQDCRHTHRREGATPLDCGGTNGSDHSYRLTKLVRLGLAEHKKLGCAWGEAPTRWRGSKVYRPTEEGRLRNIAWREAKRKEGRSDA